MANRINGNVIIIDSAMGNAFIMDSASMIRNMREYKIQAMNFFMLGTNAAVTITQANTSTDVVFTSNILSVGILSNNGAIMQNPQQMTFPSGIRVQDLKVPILTAGTAYLYLQ